MRGTCYTIEQYQSQWVVSVCGTKILTCKTKRTALKAARNALVLLHQSQEAEFLAGAERFRPRRREDDRCRASVTMAETCQG
jgi:hypothetical protein